MVMKRIVSILLAILVVICIPACAPDNVVTPVTPPAVDTTPDEIETPVANDKEEPDTDVETPVTEDGAIKSDRKENTGVVPTYNLDENNTLTVKTEILRDKDVTMFVTENGTFSAGELDELGWLKALETHYGLKVNAVMRSDATLYSAQNIAIKSGMKLDIVTARMNDISASLSLMKSASEYVSENAVLPFSQNVFKKTGGKVFAPTGSTRMLWYNTDIIADDSPYTLAKGSGWTTEVFSAFTVTAKNKSAKFLECDNWISFGSAAGEQATGITENGFVFTVASPKSIESFKTFAKITAAENTLTGDEYSFSAGNTAFVFTDTPEKKEFKVSFAPIPSLDANSSDVAEICGVGVGIPKHVSDEQAQISAVFAALWATRATEARVDELLFDIGLNAEKAESYLTISENAGVMTNADAQVEALFKGAVIPETLCSDAATTYNSFYTGYNRAAIIRERY